MTEQKTENPNACMPLSGDLLNNEGASGRAGASKSSKHGANKQQGNAGRDGFEWLAWFAGLVAYFLPFIILWAMGIFINSQPDSGSSEWYLLVFGKLELILVFCVSATAAFLKLCSKSPSDIGLLKLLKLCMSAIALKLRNKKPYESNSDISLPDIILAILLKSCKIFLLVSTVTTLFLYVIGKVLLEIADKSSLDDGSKLWCFNFVLFMAILISGTLAFALPTRKE